MKIMLISTPVFTIPLAAYGGLEQIVYNLGVEFQKAGHQVSIVAPEGSKLPEGMELIPIPYRCTEEIAYQKYKDRLGEFDVVADHTWQFYSAFSQMEAGRQLPIAHYWHSDPNYLTMPPPIQYPCMVAFSEAQAVVTRHKWNCAVKSVHHGIDLSFYTPASVQRTTRYLFLARYTVEKGFLDIAASVKKCRVQLDAFGNKSLAGDPNYVQACLNQNDGRAIIVGDEITREQTVEQYRSHRALITWPNYLEAFGLTTVEAMACGCPVLSKDSGAARELIIHGKTGFLFNNHEELDDLLSNNAVDKIDPADCRKQAEKFSIERSAKRHLKVFEDIAGGFYW